MFNNRFEVALPVQQEMALRSRKTYGDECFEKWEFVSSGGFGRVCKARLKNLGIDVAIKILHDGSSSSSMILRDEAKYMDMASFNFVVRLYGMYQGCPPGKGPSTQQGLVMEFVEGGSVQSLQEKLGDRPPWPLWPLVSRLSHEVAQGMNFLHTEHLMHLDLKPSNVLLNDNLNAKIADFGLSRVSASASNSNKETTGAIGGSFKYMPPEALQSLSYEPVRSFDVYSYGILLWTIATGEDPYPLANYDRVALSIPKGDRPCCKEIEQMKVDGLKELIPLMKECWHGSPNQRPTFIKCLDVTEKVLSMHSMGIDDAVRQVKRLMSPNSNTSNTSEATNVSLQTAEYYDSFSFAEESTYDSVDSGRSSTKTMSIQDKAKFVDRNWAELIQDVSEVMAITEALGDMVHPETLSKIGRQDTSQDKMRMLHGPLRSGGDKVKAAFYDALKAQHLHLVERLGGSF
ncbi:receptor-interacting serine/threonine-protein kinase 4-like isoform X1 [Trematomus bernacchii]|uniref:receptor-interacting serine/threonine-protein kinase 4-like isoform X1 n=2 Tax=Trematomus bernacchii TaxID=40690 RepID=UPI00146C9DBC|nr:receptor-interacting serine/threonine-protein kinase 4-like isoform X1 [Trematomus bernacchii]